MPQNDRRPTTTDYRRPIIGILAIFFLLGAIAFEIWPPTQAVGFEWHAACWRLSILLAVLWIAYRDMKRIPWWLWLAMPVVIFILVRFPRQLILLIPFLILLVLLSLRIKGR